MRALIARSRLAAATLVVGVFAVGVIAVPALGQVGPAAVASPDGAAAPSEKPGKGPKAEKVPEARVTLSGKVGTRTDADGASVYTLTVGSKVYDLEAGPPWFWGATHPLAPYVGKTATITGEQAKGSTSIDVLTVDGKTIRDPGKPAWAGGWKDVGKAHPGWAQWKADKAAAKQKGSSGRLSWAGPKTPAASGAPSD